MKDINNRTDLLNNKNISKEERIKQDKAIEKESKRIRNLDFTKSFQNR